jgi:hypothetical protein
VPSSTAVTPSDGFSSKEMRIMHIAIAGTVPASLASAGTSTVDAADMTFWAALAMGLTAVVGSVVATQS